MTANDYNFSPQRWQSVLSAYELWWKDATDRPLFNVAWTRSTDDTRPAGRILKLSDYPLDVPIEEICSDIAFALSRRIYVADGYPTYLPDFGAGVNAAFSGARTIVRPETVWFEARTPQPIEQIKLKHNSDDRIYRRIVDFYTQADAFFHGNIVLGMTHLNNGIDIPARFMNTADLCMALIDQPNEVLRLVWENHELFKFYLESLTQLIKHNPGYTCFGNLLAPKPWFGTQCDFCALIGPDHFDKYVLPELEECMKYTPKYNFYHLDGREELIHLDKILDIPELQVIQWVAGAGELPDIEWMWLYKKISKAGKKLWYCGPGENLDILADTLGSLKGVYWSTIVKEEDQDDLLKLLDKFNVPA